MRLLAITCNARGSLPRLSCPEAAPKITEMTEGKIIALPETIPVFITGLWLSYGATRWCFVFSPLILVAAAMKRKPA
ncbi:MAG: hypothetical protein M3Z09_05305 [Acidobacteriota bacterium]|nr:hypothetical protein [Acidobacteriota bacterium]